MKDQALEIVTEYFFGKGIFSSNAIFKFLCEIFPSEQKYLEYGDDRYKILFYDDIEGYEKESKEIFNYDEMTEKEFLKRRKFFKPDFKKFYHRIENFKLFLEQVDDVFLINDIFQTIINEKDLSTFADVFGIRPLRSKIHQLADINFVFDDYYLGKKIPDVDYFYLLTHPKSNMFFERIVASVDLEDFVHEKLLNIAMTIFIMDLKIVEETRQMICEKNPRIAIKEIFISNGYDFRKISIDDYPFAKKLILDKIKLFGSRHVENSHEISSIEKFTYTDEERFGNFMEEDTKNLIEIFEF